jgi:hypothetical protein
VSQHSASDYAPSWPIMPLSGAFCARDGACSRVPRRAAGDLPLTASAGQYDPEGNSCDDAKLAASAASATGLWTCGKPCALPTIPQAQPPQKRSINALRTPVNLTRQQQPPTASPRPPKSPNPREPHSNDRKRASPRIARFVEQHQPRPVGEVLNGPIRSGVRRWQSRSASEDRGKPCPTRFSRARTGAISRPLEVRKRRKTRI